MIQIVPRRTAAPDGIGDYAVRLAEGLWERRGIPSVFLSGTPVEVDPATDDNWPTLAVRSRSSRALIEALDLAQSLHACSAVLLHVGGYGYQKRGVPLWLLQGMRQWRRRAPSTRLIIVFHELYAKGKVWNSSFWLGPLQKHVARELWLLADGGITTNTRYLADLLAWRPAAASRLAIMPVISTVCEPVEVRDVNKRPLRAAIFGMPGGEAHLYETHGHELRLAVEALGLREIVDIGARLKPPPSRVGECRVIRLGVQAATAVSRELQHCRYGFLAYDIARLGKSSTFAAYAVHGVIPVCLGSDAAPADGLVSGQHFLRPPLPTTHAAELLSMQRNIVLWYRGHDASQLTQLMVDLVGYVPPIGGQFLHAHQVSALE